MDLTNLFARLNSRERAVLRCKLDRASRALLAEYDLLKETPNSVLTSYNAIPTDWLMACVETGRLKVELDQAAPVTAGVGWPDADHSSDGGFRYPVNHGSGW